MTKKIPKLRFKGFTDEWEEKELGTEVADITGGGTPNTSIPEYWNGNIDWYSPTEIGREVYANGSVKQITELGLKNSSAKLLPAGKTILFTSRAGIGDLAILQRPGTTNQGFQSLVLKEGYDTHFFYSMGHLIKQFAEKYSSGSTFLEISGKMLSQMRMNIPSAIEQSQIGSFFKNFDALIALHQRKQDKLLTVKKAMLENIFPNEDADVPEIRFKGFTGKWERRKLEEVARFRRGSFPQPYGNKEWYDGDGAMPFVQVIDVTETLSLVENTKQKISTIAQAKSVFVEKGKIVVTLQGSIGRVAIVQYDAYVDRTLLIFEEFKRKLDAQFWAYTIQQKFEIEKKKAPGGTIKTITKAALSVFQILLPAYSEQKKIGAFFQSLDSLISLHQRELDKLKNIKKACLEKMFV